MPLNKRLLLVLGPSSGGIRRHVRYLAQNPPSGWEVAAVAGPASLSGFFEGAGFLPWERMGGGIEADLIHAHGFQAARRALRWRGGVPLVVSVHTSPDQRLGPPLAGRFGGVQALAWKAGRAIAARADAVICVSPRTAALLPGAHLIPPALELAAAPARSREEVRRSLGVAGGAVVALSVARLHPDKGVDLFIRAVAASGAEGWVAGDGPERARLEQAAAGTGVRLLGQRQDVPDLLGAADLFALAAPGEAYGFSVLEAVAAGLPVVATAVGALPGLVGGAARLVEPGDEAGFVREVVALCGSAELRGELAAQASRAALPDPIQLTARIGEVYRSVLEPSG